MISLMDYMSSQLNEAFDPSSLPAGVDLKIINTAIGQGLKDIKYLKNGKLKIKYDTRAASTVTQMAFEELIKLGTKWDFVGSFQFSGTSLHDLHLISKKGYNGSWDATDHLTITNCIFDTWWQINCKDCLCKDCTFNEPFRVAGYAMPRLENCKINRLIYEIDIPESIVFNKRFDAEKYFNLKNCTIDGSIFCSHHNYTFYQTKAQMDAMQGKMARPDNKEIELKNGWWVTYRE